MLGLLYFYNYNIIMGRKGKTQKHTAAEINAKHKAAKEAKGAAGGGNSGVIFNYFKLKLINLPFLKNHLIN